MKSRLMVIGLFLALTMGIITISSSTAQAAGCGIVTIHGRSGAEPMVLSSKVGDCVIFINFSGDATTLTEEVKIQYKEGASCQAATKKEAVFGFDLDANKCFSTGWLRYGQNASLLFVKAGTYTYDVYFKTGGPPLSGKVIVK